MFDITIIEKLAVFSSVCRSTRVKYQPIVSFLKKFPKITILKYKKIPKMCVGKFVIGIRTVTPIALTALSSTFYFDI